MKKSLIILTAMLLPAALFAQSALGQLEHLAGMSVHDVPVPKASDPVRVDDEEEEQKSTKLKDYTPAEETQQTTMQTSQPKPKTWQELQQEREEQARLQREAEIQRQIEEDNRRHWNDVENWTKRYEERISHQQSLYDAFLAGPPEVHLVPMFSSINEHKIVFDHPMSSAELRKLANIVVPDYDSTYTADKLYYSSRTTSPAYFLGRRLANGRTEWRIFSESFTAFTENYGVLGLGYTENKNIRDVKFVGEGRVILLEMDNGEKYVLSPEGKVHCKGRNISFPVMSGDGLFIECDGKLFISNMPEYYRTPLLQGIRFNYYRKTVVVTNYFDSPEDIFYVMCNYGGKTYDVKEHKWKKHAHNSALDYIAPFSNDGQYYVIKPRGKKYYQIVSYSDHGELFQGKKKYKTLEAAHAGWSKEKATIYKTKPALSE